MVIANCIYFNPKNEQLWIIDYRIYDPDTDKKTKIDHVEEMILNAINNKKIPSNCKNSTSAKEVLTKILTYLERNLVRLDKQYMSSTYQQSFKRQQQVRLELQGLEQAIASYGDINAQYVVLRDKFVLQLYNDIEKFREEKREECTRGHG